MSCQGMVTHLDLDFDREHIVNLGVVAAAPLLGEPRVGEEAEVDGRRVVGHEGRDVAGLVPQGLEVLLQVDVLVGTEHVLAVLALAKLDVDGVQDCAIVKGRC